MRFLGNIDQSVPTSQIRLYRKVPYLFTGENGSAVIMSTFLSLYHGLNNRLKTHPDSVLFSFFSKGASTISQGIFHITGKQLLHASNAKEGSAIEGDWISTYPEKQQPLLRTTRKALRKFKPRTFLGNLTLFSTGPDWKSYPSDLTRGWNEFTKGKTIIINIPGKHSTLYLEPFAHEVAQKIEEALDRVDADE